MAYKIFSHTPDTSACCLYRNRLPFLHLYGELAQQGIRLLSQKKSEQEEEYDCYIFNRLIRPDFYRDQIMPLVGKKTLVFQTDDDVWHVPEWNPSIRYFGPKDLSSTAEFIKQSKYIVTSTKPLADLINQPEKTFILPNLIDLTFFDDIKKIENKPLRVLWCGSSSHHGDLESHIEPIIKIVEKYKDVNFIFWGYLPSELAEFQRVPGYPYAEIVPKYSNVYKGEWYDIDLYFNKLTELKPDIAIVPVEDCPFNYSKSNLKWLEMTMAGAACIASDLPPYQCIRHKETGMLVKSNDDWYDMLSELIENKELRLKIASNAKVEIIDEHSWQCHKRKLWSDFFIKVAT